MKNKVSIRKLDKLGRITLPSNLRKVLNMNDLEELEIIADTNKIIIRKQNHPDIFGNSSDNDSYFEYRGNKVSKESIIELSKIAGLI
nr:AbrB/MazE/SpoVT family DNA-binding domain-containing protein [uncultured Catonella sp.]